MDRMAPAQANDPPLRSAFILSILFIDVKKVLAIIGCSFAALFILLNMG
jgi:hypothetical protein